VIVAGMTTEMTGEMTAEMADLAEGMGGAAGSAIAVRTTTRGLARLAAPRRWLPPFYGG
jgi:hypothetical protein